MSIDVNVTKIVKYVCLAGVAILAIIFGEKAYAEYVRAKKQQEES